MLLIGINAPAGAQDHEQRFLQGMMKEEGEGNLAEAIDIYTALANDDTADRSIRAKALLQMGICYEKLGKENATVAYQRLIREYADQTDLTTIAREKLRVLKNEPEAVVSSDLVSERIARGINWGIVPYNISPDGRFYTYFESAGDEIMVYDLINDRKDSITSSAPGEVPWAAVWSPDGNKIAYTLYTNEEGRQGAIYLINRDGTNREVILSGEEALGVSDVQSFSPDGRKILFARKVDSEGLIQQELMELTLATKEFRKIHTISEGSDGGGDNFRYSPDQKYIAYSRGTQPYNGDIYVLNLENGQSVQVTHSTAHDSEVAWSPKGDKILFVSNRLGSNDLFEAPFNQGAVVGEASVVRRNLGDSPSLMGIDADGALYYSALNSRSDIYTVDLDPNMDLDPSSVDQISSLKLPGKNGLARYSKDGRYISFQNGMANQMDGLDEWTKAERFTPGLGFKYAIYIHDTQTSKTKLLDLPLYLNHSVRSNLWHAPTWSYFGDKLLVSGRIEEGLKGGFLEVDAVSGEIHPLLVEEDSYPLKNSLGLGLGMIYSRVDKDRIFYSTPDWKMVQSYNRATGEEKVIAEIPEGFWFEGFLDEEETQIYARNRFGHHSYDVRDGSLTTFAESGAPYLFVPEDQNGYKWHLLISKWYLQNTKTQIELKGKDGVSKLLNLSEIFPDCIIHVEDKHPSRNRLLLTVTRNPGSEIYKLTNIFSDVKNEM